MLRKSAIRKLVPWALIGLVVGVGALFAARGYSNHEEAQTSQEPASNIPVLVSLAPGQTDTLLFAENALTKMGCRLATVEPAPPPPPLRLQGRIDLDANTLLRIKARFPGEVIEIASVAAPVAAGGTRPLQWGDHVTKGQLLAVIRSKEVGEKKSELMDALSKLHTNEDILDRLEKAEQGAIAKRSIIDAQRDYEQAAVAVSNARRTLLSWQISEDEIDAVYREAEKLKHRAKSDAPSDTLKQNIATDTTWANTLLRSASNGVILEKNINKGDMVDPADDLFKIADTSHTRVLARVYEEDLPMLRALAPDKRHWKIDLKSDPFDEPISGTFEIVGGIIDPADHTGTVTGTLLNAGGRMNLGQFVTATIDLDADPAMVAVPAKAVIEDGSLAAVFVQDNVHPNEFTRRLVAITSRIPGQVCIRSKPHEAERHAGATTLHAGERVLASGVLELNAELATLKAAQPEVQARVHMP